MKFTEYDLKEVKSLKGYNSEWLEDAREQMFGKYLVNIDEVITHYLFIFYYKQNVYTIKTDKYELTSDLVKVSTESKGGLKLMLRINATTKSLWVKRGATKLCSIKHFEKLVKESKYNRGEIAEKIVTEKRGQVWHKDNVRFDKSGDITMKRHSIQVKFQNASLASFKTILKADSEI